MSQADVQNDIEAERDLLKSLRRRVDTLDNQTKMLTRLLAQKEREAHNARMWRIAAETVLAEVEINHEPALDMIDRVVGVFGEDTGQ